MILEMQNLIIIFLTHILQRWLPVIQTHVSTAVCVFLRMGHASTISASVMVAMRDSTVKHVSNDLGFLAKSELFFKTVFGLFLL